MRFLRIIILVLIDNFKKIYASLYLDFLTCYQEQCTQLEQQCLSSSLCQIAWNQFLICENQSFFYDYSQQCFKKYMDDSEQNSALSHLLKCYDSCEGLIDVDLLKKKHKRLLKQQ
ncbi:hypothetical protein ABPG74_007171 [Tetrahymena malaccensis]